MELLIETGIIEKERLVDLYKESDELISIFVSIVLKLKSRLK